MILGCLLDDDVEPESHIILHPVSNPEPEDNYYQDFTDLKHEFIDGCMVANKYEVHKLWAHWLIRNLCHQGFNYHVIPNPEVRNDPHLINYLNEQGLDLKEVAIFYGRITARLQDLYRKYHLLKVKQLQDPTKMLHMAQQIVYEQKIRKGNRYHFYRFIHIYVKFDEQTHNKLIMRYKGDPRSFKFNVFEMGFNYYMLDGHSFHWCVPPRVMSLLIEGLSTTTELFASPINVTLPHYYSLFYIDRLFGAIDHFFNIVPTSIIEGTYEVNPPFIEHVFVESSRMIQIMLTQSQAMDKDLMFVYIMPDWLDSLGYTILAQSTYLLDEIILQSKNHCYYQSDINKMILANFETHLLIIGTTRARLRWNSGLRQRLIDNFR